MRGLLGGGGVPVGGEARRSGWVGLGCGRRSLGVNASGLLRNSGSGSTRMDWIWVPECDVAPNGPSTDCAGISGGVCRNCVGDEAAV